MKNILLISGLGLLLGLPSPAVPTAAPSSIARSSARPLAPDSTTVRLIFGTDQPELTEVLSRVLEVEKHRLQFHDPRLAGRHLHLSYQEFRLGVPGKELPLTTSTDRALTQLDSLGQFRFTVYARQLSSEKVENRFLLPRAMLRREFQAATGRANQYSLRPDIHREYRSKDQAGRPATDPATEIHLPIGPKVPLLVYTVPYEKDGMLLYCGLAQSHVPLGQWYQQFKVPHFVVYYLRIE